MARETKESRLYELELEVERLRRENQELRSKYADLFLRTRKSAETLRDLELQAANLLQAKGEKGAIEQQAAAVEALSYTIAKLLDVQEALQNLEKAMSSLMEVMQPSEAARAEVVARQKVLEDSVQKVVRILNTASSTNASIGNCSIIDLKDETGLVIVDVGTLAGVRPGRRWMLKAADGTVNARLVTVDARAEISALVLTQGEMAALRIGTVLTPENSR